MDEVKRRAAQRPADYTIGELLLDQQVVSGIGNIYRCEALFQCRTHPKTPWPDADLDALVAAASKTMRAQLSPSARHRAEVYGRTGRPCRRCGTRIESETYGAFPRTAYWCPRCQARERVDGSVG
jgi:endonuclease-8